MNILKWLKPPNGLGRLALIALPPGFFILLGTLPLSLCFAEDKKALYIPLHAAVVSLNPSSVQDLSSLWVSRQVNCQLLRLEGSSLTLEAAEQIKMVTPTEIHLKIRESAHFNDGSPVSTDDVIASFEHLRASRKVFRNIFLWVKEIKKVDMRNLIFYLKKSTPLFLKVLAAPNYAIFKKSFLKMAESKPELWDAPMGCGGYKIVSNKGNRIEILPLAKGRPVNFLLGSANQISAEDMTKFDIIDLKTEVSNSASELFRKIRIFDPSQIYLGLNTKMKRWASKNNRCEFFAKLKPALAVAEYGDSAEEATDFLPRGILGYKKHDNFHKTTSTLKNRDGDKNNFPFCLAFLTVSIPLKYRNGYVNMVAGASSAVSTTEIIVNKHFGQDFLKMNCDGIVVGLKSNYLDGYEYLLMASETDVNFTGFSERETSQLIEESQKIEDSKERVAAYRRIIENLEKECIVYPVLTITTKIVYIKKDLQTPGIGAGALNEYYIGNVL